ncbi:hypothetical protein IQ269_24415 [Tychonema sp. LEGE 07199]|uniref:hypothetical protein n=1 Tax=unclassified Tychonema TaxID=2642144 RepID=UPI00188303E1|nr:MULTISPECIES: hypothetical protein [unclassified Tychonema]MBE9123856.1 hypothetical protein [Tychonema sp. LEGE 07199]MBE9131938.1 hypothetical protein [Tychonema sp. LEGE 07196]
MIARSDSDVTIARSGDGEDTAPCRFPTAKLSLGRSGDGGHGAVPFSYGKIIAGAIGI